MFSVRIQTCPLTLRGDEGTGHGTPEYEGCGAVVRFVGRVRNDARNAPLSHLVLEHFPGVTEAEIERIIAQARRRWNLQGARVVHRVGRIGVGEAIVLVETASAHRHDAYEANAFVMDYLKTEAPFWKQEFFADASARWVEARPSDQAAQQRWARRAATPRRIGALVLAGGASRRMNGRNKGLQPFHGQPLAQHVVRALQPQVDYLAISANQDLPAYQALGLPVFSDDPAWLGAGPLAGLASALPQFPPDLDAILVAPCDTPLLPAQLVPRLAEALFGAGGPPAVCAATSDGPHPSILLLRPALLLGLPRHLQNQRQSQSQADLSLRGWLAQGGWGTVFFEDAQAFVNINDLATLQHLQLAAEGTGDATGT